MKYLIGNAAAAVDELLMAVAAGSVSWQLAGSDRIGLPAGAIARGERAAGAHLVQCRALDAAGAGVGHDPALA